MLRHEHEHHEQNEHLEEEAELLIPKDTNNLAPPPDSSLNKVHVSLSPSSVKIFSISIPLSIVSNPPFLFISLSFCCIICSLIFAFLQEKVTSIDGFKYPRFMTVIQTITFTLCAFGEMIFSFGNQGSLLQPKAPKRNYFILSFLTFSGMLFTNWGLKYLSYPTRIIFKGAKPVPTMILEYLYVGKIFTLNEIISVGILTFGIILFCSGEAAGAPSFNSYGVLLMMLGVTADSLTSNFEKKNIFSFGATHTEAVFWASLYGSIWSILTLCIMDFNMLIEAAMFVLYTPEALTWLIISSMGGYMAVVFILLIIKIFSTTYAECVKGLRKVLSIALSYIFLSSDDKKFGILHELGVLCFGASILMTIYTKSQRNK
eukprot:481883_1